MVRLIAVLACLFAVPALASAQGIVVAAYAPVVTYAPHPVVPTYYTPAPELTTYYAAPTVSYYTTPSVVTYRHPLLRPYTTVVRTYPGTTVAVPTAPVVTSYPPVVIR
jgi:hypothetical protein